MITVGVVQAAGPLLAAVWEIQGWISGVAYRPCIRLDLCVRFDPIIRFRYIYIYTYTRSWITRWTLNPLNSEIWVLKTPNSPGCLRSSLNFQPNCESMVGTGLLERNFRFFFSSFEHYWGLKSITDDVGITWVFNFRLISSRVWKYQIRLTRWSIIELINLIRPCGCLWAWLHSQIFPVIRN